MADVAVWTLLALNLVQFAFWGFLVNRLVNKLMSRDYSEFQRADKPEKASRMRQKESVRDPDEEPIDFSFIEGMR